MLLAYRSSAWLPTQCVTKPGLSDCMREPLQDLGLPTACGLLSSLLSRQLLMPAMLTEAEASPVSTPSVWQRAGLQRRIAMPPLRDPGCSHARSRRSHAEESSASSALAGQRAVPGALSEAGACLIRSMLIRAAYGGLQGDVRMLRRSSALWLARHALPLAVDETLGALRRMASILVLIIMFGPWQPD